VKGKVVERAADGAEPAKEVESGILGYSDKKREIVSSREAAPQKAWGL